MTRRLLTPFLLQRLLRTGLIVAHTRTDQEGDDPSQIAPLLDQIPGEIGRVIADGAYDGAPTYQTVAQHSPAAQIVIPPRSTAVRSCETGPPTQRDRHLEAIEAHGRPGWQKATGYGRRAIVETAMGRYKALIGPRLRLIVLMLSIPKQAIGVATLDRMLAAACANSVRCKAHYKGFPIERKHKCGFLLLPCCLAGVA
nr:transposase [Paraburkholderia sp. BL10I2N1]